MRTFFLKEKLFEPLADTNFFFEFRKPFKKNIYLSLSTDY
jgi:hypothetical protein